MRKKAVSVNVHFAEVDGVCSTLEGKVGYEKGDAILTGARGESWPVSRQRFFQTYQPREPDKLRFGDEGAYVKRPLQVLAMPLKTQIQIPLSGDRGVLTGKPGDWLIQFSPLMQSEVGPLDQGVVQSHIFEQTYEEVRGGQ